MNNRTIQEIEAEMDEVSKTGNIGRMMDLVDEHGNTYDQMYQAIIDGDLDRIADLEKLGMEVTAEGFVKAAIIHDQLLVTIYQVSKGAEIDMIINFAQPRDEPLENGTICFSGNQLIWQWAKSWKSVNTMSKNPPPKDNQSASQVTATTTVAAQAEAKKNNIEMFYKLSGTTLTIDLKEATPDIIDEAIEDLTFLLKDSIERLQREKSNWQ